MDPYIERPAIWADFRLSFLAAAKAQLRQALRPRYAALIQHRFLWIKEREEEVREQTVHIIEVKAQDRVITAIDLLSPDNKEGSGREGYCRQRQELWDAGANLVEIDLLRAGDPVSDLPTFQELMQDLNPRPHYSVTVSRRELPAPLRRAERKPLRQAVYPISLQSPLPRIAVPLGEGESDLALDLQAAFTACWSVGPYPELLQYDGPPPGPLTADEIAWCEGLLRNAGFRPAS
jgi:hypothetical protein